MKLFKIKNLFDVPSLLNIAGIAIAVAAFYIIMAVADFDLTYNHSIKDYENVYNLSISYNGGNYETIMNRPIGEEFGQQIPSVISYGCLNPWVDWSLFAERNGEYQQMSIRTAAVSKGLLETFDIKILEGDTSQFDNNLKIIIHRETAKKFGIKVGDFLRFDLNIDIALEVVAIYDLAPNTELQPFGALRCIGRQHIENKGWSITAYFYKTSTPIDEKTINHIKSEVFKKVYNFNIDDPNNGLNDEDREKLKDDVAPWVKVKFTSLADIHLAPEMGGYHEPANAKIVYTLLILAIVIIIIAYINYVNFFFARVPKRIKSINTMKIFGASRTQLMGILVGESLIYTCVSMILAFIMVHTIAPTLVGDAVDMNLVFSNHKILAISIIIPIITAIAISIYPAYHITSIDPALGLKGVVTQTNDKALRYILIGFQIAASVALIIVSMFIHKNTDYIATTDLGFNRDNLLGVETSNRISSKRDDVRSMLLQNPDIIDVTWARSQLIARNRHNVTIYTPDLPNVNVAADVIFVSDNFLKFMGIDIESGRDFMPSDHHSKTGVYIVNQTASHAYGITAEHRLASISCDSISDIIGVCKDFKFKPLHYGVSPLLFFIPGESTPQYAELKQLYIRIANNADIKKTSKYIENTLAQIDPDFAYMNLPVRTFNNEMMQGNYSKEENLTRLITIFAMIAILISIMGVFGIVYFEMEHRQKEIGIRKVNGASALQILAMFNRKYMIITIVCALIAVPLAFVIINAYFNGFAYHYAINLWIFIIGVVIVMAITALVVTAASFRAANENPVNTLKTE